MLKIKNLNKQYATFKGNDMITYQNYKFVEEL